MEHVLDDISSTLFIKDILSQHVIVAFVTSFACIRNKRLSVSILFHSTLSAPNVPHGAIDSQPRLASLQSAHNTEVKHFDHFTATKSTRDFRKREVFALHCIGPTNPIHKR
jgi:hypothetical protein